MNALTILKGIWNHPFNKDHKLAAIGRFFKWQINCRLNPYDVVYPLTQNGLILARKGMTGVTGCIYNGLLEFEDMMFLLHLLRKDDHFVDIGANVGVYSILASAEIGANTLSIEPIPSTYETLSRNLEMNVRNTSKRALNIGLGKQKGQLFFTQTLDTVNHVLPDGAQRDNAISVEIFRLDDIIKEDQLPILVKIDVEGFELEVLQGAGNILQDIRLKAIIIELNGSGERYGFKDDDVHQLLLEHGFAPHSYEPYSRQLEKLSQFGTHNTLYLRDLEFVKERILSATRITIQHKSI